MGGSRKRYSYLLVFRKWYSYLLVLSFICCRPYSHTPHTPHAPHTPPYTSYTSHPIHPYPIHPHPIHPYPMHYPAYSKGYLSAANSLTVEGMASRLTVHDAQKICESEVHHTPYTRTLAHSHTHTLTHYTPCTIPHTPFFRTILTVLTVPHTLYTIPHPPQPTCAGFTFQLVDVTAGGTPSLTDPAWLLDVHLKTHIVFTASGDGWHSMIKASAAGAVHTYTRCAPTVHTYTRCALSVHSLCAYLHPLCSLCALGVLAVHSLYSPCTLPLLSLCSRCALPLLSLCTRCAPTVLFLYSRCALAVLPLCSPFTLSVLPLYSLSLHSLCSRCALTTLAARSLYILHPAGNLLSNEQTWSHLGP
jgi:hypothetical protein